MHRKKDFAKSFFTKRSLNVAHVIFVEYKDLKAEFVATCGPPLGRFFLMSEMIQESESFVTKPQKPCIPLWKRILFCPAILEKSDAQKIAYIGVMTALCIVANMFLEFKFMDVQFSLTIFASVLTGMLIGPVFGAAAVFLGDFIGYVYNNWGLLYMPWVGISCAAMAIIAGLVMKLPFKFKGSAYVKLAIICILVLLVCSIGINTTGFYVYYTRIGFSKKALGYIESSFGGTTTYWAYAMVRFIFLGQAINSLVNYALLFAAVPLLKAVKPLKLTLL